MNPTPRYWETIEGLSAAQASAPVGEKGFSVAAHTEHLRWSFSAGPSAKFGAKSNGLIGKKAGRWRTVDEEAWQKLRAELRTEFEALRPIFEAGTDWTAAVCTHGIDSRYRACHVPLRSNQANISYGKKQNEQRSYVAAYL